MNKLNNRNITNLMVVLFLLAGVFLLSGCGNENGSVLFSSESETKLTEEASSQKGDMLSQESDMDEIQNDSEVAELAETNSAKKDPDSGQTNSESQTCYVYVCGAIVSPGVYEVEFDTRICEVIQFAGGLTPEAETTCINQALAVYDGLMLNIPTVDQWKNGEFYLDEKGFPIQRLKSEQSIDASGNVEESVVDDGKIDINTATVEQLCTLPGVGTSRAESIIAYREEHGGFKKIEDIKNVAGIKDGLFKKIKEKIKV